MARGALSGIIWGTVVSASALGIASVSMPLQRPPQEPATAVQETVNPKLSMAGVQQPDVVAFAQTPVALPEQPDALTPAAEDMAPQVDASLAADLPVPQTGTSAELMAPQVLPDTAAEVAGVDDPVLPNPQALAPMEPADIPPSPISTETAALPQFDPAPELPTETAQIDSGTDSTTQVAVIADPSPLTEPANPDDAAPQADVETPEPPKPDVQVAVLAPETSATPPVDGAPSIGTPATSLIDRTPDAETASEAPQTPEAQTTAPDELTGNPPIRMFAQKFVNLTEKPLMSIVLQDNGVDLDADEIGLTALRSFPYPISFAVDASLKDAAQRMQRYREEGFEVLALIDLPQGAVATDAEVSLSIVLDKMPEVVGVMGGTDGGLQTTREAADHVTSILAQTGHGLVTQATGLNTATKLARKAGVPAKAIFRDIDSKGQNARTVRRFLDQAAFKADQEGGVVLVGRLRPETIEALLVWALADRAGQVALAPISAVLLQP